MRYIAVLLLLPLLLLAVAPAMAQDGTRPVTTSRGVYHPATRTSPGHDRRADRRLESRPLGGMGHSIAGTGANGLGAGDPGLNGRHRTAEREIGTNVTLRNDSRDPGSGSSRHPTSPAATPGRLRPLPRRGRSRRAPHRRLDHRHVVRDSVFRENTGTVLRRDILGIVLGFPAQGIIDRTLHHHREQQRDLRRRLHSVSVPTPSMLGHRQQRRDGLFTATAPSRWSRTAPSAPTATTAWIRARRRRDHRLSHRGQRRRRRAGHRARRVEHPRQLDHRQRPGRRRRRRLAVPGPEQLPEQHRQRVLRGGRGRAG